MRNNNRKKTIIGVLVVAAAFCMCGFIILRAKSSYSVPKSTEAAAPGGGDNSEFEVVPGDGGGDATAAALGGEERPSATETSEEEAEPTRKGADADGSGDAADEELTEDDDWPDYDYGYDDEYGDNGYNGSSGGGNGSSNNNSSNSNNSSSNNSNNNGNSNSNNSNSNNNKNNNSNNSSSDGNGGNKPVSTGKPAPTNVPAPQESAASPQESAAVSQESAVPTGSSQPTAMPQPADRRVVSFSVSGEFPKCFNVNQELEAEDFSGISAVAQWSDGKMENVPYGMYEVKCSTEKEGSFFASFSYGGVTSAVAVPYRVAQFRVILKKVMFIPEVMVENPADGENYKQARTFGTNLNDDIIFADAGKRVDLSKSFVGYQKDINADTSDGAFNLGFSGFYKRADGTSVYRFVGWADEEGNIYTEKYQMGDVEEITLNPVYHTTRDFTVSGAEDSEEIPEEECYLVSTDETDGKQRLIGYAGKKEEMDSIPDGVAVMYIDSKFIWGENTPPVKKIVIPDGMKEVDFAGGKDGGRIASLEEISVSAGNPNYSDKNGVLYDKDGESLLRVPPALSDQDGCMPESSWDGNCKVVKKDAFAGTSLKKLVVPENVTEFKDNWNRNALSIREVTLQAGKVTVGDGFLANEPQDESRIYHFDSQTPPELVFGKLADGAKMPLIYAPASAYDEVYKEYLLAYGADVSAWMQANGESGAVGAYIRSEDGAENRYSCEIDGDSVTVWDAQTEKTLEAAPASSSKQEKVSKKIYGREVKEIGSHSFKACGAVQTVVVSDTVESVHAYAFDGAENLQKLKFDREVPPAIGDHIFGDKLPEDMHIVISAPKDAEKSYAVMDGSNSAQAARQKYVEAWKEQLDYDYGKGTAKRIIMSKSDLTYQTVVDGVLYKVHETCRHADADHGNDRELIGVLGGYKDMTSLKVPEGTIAIAKDALAGCGRLETISLPATLESIGERAFDGCSGLRVITLEAKDVPRISDGAFDGAGGDEQLSVMVPQSAEGAYRSAWDDAGDIAIRSYGESYGEKDGILYADSYNKRLVYYVSYNKQGELQYSAVIPEGNAKLVLKERHCAGRTRIRSVRLDVPDMEIGAAGYAGCTGLTELHVVNTPKWQSTITMFKDCGGLDSVYLYGHDGKLCVPDRFMAGNTSLKRILFVRDSLVSGVSSIGKSAFEGCSSLAEVRCLGLYGGSEKLESVGSRAFAGCPLAVFEVDSSVPPHLGDNIFGDVPGVSDTFRFILPDAETGYGANTVKEAYWNAWKGKLDSEYGDWDYPEASSSEYEEGVTAYWLRYQKDEFVMDGTMTSDLLEGWTASPEDDRRTDAPDGTAESVPVSGSPAGAVPPETDSEEAEKEAETPAESADVSMQDSSTGAGGTAEETAEETAG